MSLRPHFHPRKRTAPLPSGLQVTTYPTPASGHRYNENMQASEVSLIRAPSSESDRAFLGFRKPPMPPCPRGQLVPASTLPGFFPTRLRPCSHTVPVAWPHHIRGLPLPPGHFPGSLPGHSPLGQGSGWMGSSRGLPGENSSSYRSPTRPSDPKRLSRLREGRRLCDIT